MKEKIDIILKEIIKEAQDLNIPVPACVHEEVFVNPRPKKRFGCCRRTGNSFQIEISAFVLACDERQIRGIIAHEVLHTCRGCQDHGDRWKSYAAEMNRAYGYDIRRVSSMEEMGLERQEEQQEKKIKYIIKCTKCGKEYPRQRFTCVMRKIDAYRCQCGGKLVLLSVTDIHNRA